MELLFFASIVGYFAAMMLQSAGSSLFNEDGTVNADYTVEDDENK